ncbi:MAG: hypothetical protein B7Y39_19715 [Bdellovibrio sp. 28-41-41]|nr:MAG: hypothetical protein B7Y39_19715 [Bdellovibrio sp. 28-41-41]
MVVVLALLMTFLAWPGTRVHAQAQPQVQAKPQVQAQQGQSLIAEITGEYPYVYADPDFDSPVIATIKPGTFYYVSKQRFVYDFHRIRLAKNQDGYISSSEIKIVTAQYVQNRKKKGNAAADSTADTDPGTGAETKPVKKEKKKLTKPIYISRYQGLIVEQQNYIEDTMSNTRSDNVLFFGYRLVGFNTLFSGEMSTDLAVLYHSGAPAYYEKITGRPTSGQILNAQFTFDTIIPLAHNFMASYGFGPMIKYSHFEVSLKNPAGVGNDAYVLDDMNFGVLFRLGAATRIGVIGLRADVKYYIESKQYVGINVSTLYEF